MKLEEDHRRDSSRPLAPSFSEPRSRRLTCFGWSLVLATLISSVAAESVNRADAEAMTRGWLAAKRTRLAAKMSDQVKTSETFGDFHVVHLDPEGFVVIAARRSGNSWLRERDRV